MFSIVSTAMPQIKPLRNGIVSHNQTYQKSGVCKTCTNITQISFRNCTVPAGKMLSTLLPLIVLHTFNYFSPLLVASFLAEIIQ